MDDDDDDDNYRDKIVVMKIMIMSNDSAYVALVCGVGEWSVKYVLPCDLKNRTHSHEHTHIHTPRKLKEGVRE